MSPLVNSLRSFLSAGLGFVYPEVCQLCGVMRATPADSFLCADCRASIRFIRRPFCERCGLPFEGDITNTFECSACQEHDWDFSSARSVVVAQDQMLEVIHRYKYRHALWFEPFLAGLLINGAIPELAKDRWDYIVPVPLHPAKEREREFNQAERLALRLSKASGISLNTRLIRRALATRTQTLLSREERLVNVRSAFAVLRKTRLNGEHIVLVDDVFTTGATTGACARVLRQAGAGKVCVWTVARGL